MFRTLIMSSILAALLLSMPFNGVGYKSASATDLLMKGKPKADIGLNFRSTWEDRDDDKDDEGHLGWLYAELGYETAKFHGLKIGASYLVVKETWGKDLYSEAFSDKGPFFTGGTLKYLYLNYAIPNTESEIWVGRKKTNKIALMDGDVHEGIHLTVGDIPRTKLYAGVITGWVDDISQSWDLDGVEDFTRQSKDTEDRGGNPAGDRIYTFLADVDVVEKRLSLTPFWVHHPDYLTTYGSLIDVSVPINDDVTLGVDGGWAKFDEDTDFPGDEDAETWKIHASAKVSKFYVGIGYFRVSDSPDGVFQGANAAKTVGNYHWEPIKVGKVGLYAGGKGGDPGDKTIWVDAGFAMDKFSLDLVFGDSSYTHGKYGHDQDSRELDVIATYKITSTLSASLGLISQNFKNDAEKDRNFIMGGMKYSFF